MKYFRLVFPIVLFLTMQSCSSNKFVQSIDTNQTADLFIGKVDSIVAVQMNTYNIPGLSIGIVKNDSIVYSKGYGIRNIQSKETVTEGTNFHTASISKLFTAQAIMILVQENRINLDDRLINIIPELKYKDERVKLITIKSLLNHTSGLPDVSNYHWKNNHQSDERLKNYILGLNLKLNSEPLTEYSYSNLGYNILGYVIEKISGSNFDDFLKENILQKSGMTNSDFRYFKIQPSLKSSPHSKKWISNKVYLTKNYPYTREHAPSSTLNSSSKDLSKWMISFIENLNDPDLGNDFVAMTKPTVNKYPYIGLGFQLSEISSKKTIGHYGGDKGFRSYLIMLPEEKIGLVLLANCDYDEDFRQGILHPIAKLMLAMDKE